MRPPLIPALLIGGGFLLFLIAFFPISVSDWLPRSIQALIGSGAVFAGVALVEIKSWRTERETTVYAPDRPTLTLLDNDRYIIGLPTDVTQEEASWIGESFREWKSRPEPRPPLIFPYPIDVIDKRTVA